MRNIIKSISITLLIGITVASLTVTQAVQAAPITGLFNTGVDGFGVVLPGSSGSLIDTHYTVVEDDGSSSPSSAFKTPAHPAWVGAPAGSSWIGLSSSTHAATPSTFYIFTTTFDLSGLDATTASIGGRFAADDVARLFLNGVDTLIPRNSFQSLAVFNIVSGFNSGLNTFQIRVENSDFTGTNPMGLLITDFSGTADVLSAVPLPAALPLFLTGLAGLGLMRRRQRRA